MESSDTVASGLAYKVETDPDNIIATTMNMINLTSAIDSDEEDLSDLISHLKWTRYVVNILMPIVVVFGIMGNSFSVIVLTRRWMISSTSYYLTALAVCDSLYLIFATFLSFKHYAFFKDHKWYLSFHSPVGRPLVDTFSNCAVWLTLTFTIERWLCVRHPIKSRVWCTPRRALYMIALVCCAAVILTFPEFFAHRVQQKPGDDNLTAYETYTTPFAEASSYGNYVYMNQILFTFLPLILLVVCNSLLIKMVIRAAEQRNSMAQFHSSSTLRRSERQQKDQQRVTVTLISVVMVFLLCHSPQAILNIFWSYYRHSNTLSERKKLVMKIIGNIFNLLVMVNASINFVLYSTFNTKFRITFKKLSLRTYRRLYGRHGNEDYNIGRYFEASFDKDNDNRITQTTRMSRADMCNLVMSRERLNEIMQESRHTHAGKGKKHNAKNLTCL